MQTTSYPASTPLSEGVIYALCQFIGWTLVAGVAQLLGGPSLETLWTATLIVVTGFAASHALRALIKRGHWLDRPLGAWVPRLAAATLALALAWWFVVDVVINLIHSDTTLLDAMRSTLFGDFLGLNRLSALIHVSILALWAALYVAGNALRRYREAEVIAWQRTAEVREAELRALHAQLNPHFLFNALNSLRALIAEQPAQAQDAVTRLARLLRYTLRTSQVETVALDAELEAVRDYLALEKLRFEDRLQLELTVSPGAEAMRVPPLLVLTLVENAVKHGVAPRPEGGFVSLNARVKGELLTLTVRNPGTLLPASTDSEGHGLRNVRERLRLLYGGDAALQVSTGDGAEVEAEVYLPALSRTV